MQNTKMTASAWHDEMKRGGGFTWYTLNQIIDVVLSWPVGPVNTINTDQENP